MKIYSYNLLCLFTCFSKFNLKCDDDLQFTKSVGSEFHSVIDLGKREDILRYFWRPIFKRMAVACSFLTVWY